MSKLKANTDQCDNISFLHSMMRRCEVCLVVQFNFFLPYSNSRSKYPYNVMPCSDVIVIDKSSDPNGQNDKEALERENMQLREALQHQLRLQEEDQAQKKRSASPSMRQSKRTKRNNHQNYPPPPHVPVGNNSMWSLRPPPPAYSSNVGISDNHQVMLHSNRMVPNRSDLFSPNRHNLATSSTRTPIRKPVRRNSDVWTMRFRTVHNQKRQIAESLRGRMDLFDKDESMYEEQIELQQIKSARLKNEIQELAEKMKKRQDELEEYTSNSETYMDLLITTREAKAASATDLIETERITNAMSWIYTQLFHRLNHSELYTERCSILKNLNQAELQEVFQTFSIEDFQSMTFKELCRNYTQLLIRGGHEKKDSIKMVVEATEDERRGLAYSKKEELKHILADIFGFDGVPHAPVTSPR